MAAPAPWLLLAGWLAGWLAGCCGCGLVWVWSVESEQKALQAAAERPIMRERTGVRSRSQSPATGALI